MADMPTEFWGGWIVVITVTTFFALMWFVIDVYRSGDEPHEQEVWDETLREGARPAPIWWFWFILALMIVSVIYVMLYPGLGPWRGALGWSQGGHIADSRSTPLPRNRPRCSRHGASSMATAAPAMARMPPDRQETSRT